MKKLSLLIAIILSFTIFTACKNKENDKTDTKDNPNGEIAESLTATQVAKEMGIGISLGNTMEAYESSGCETIEYEWIPVVGSNTPSDYEQRWGAVITTQEAVDGIKAAGFDSIRIPVFWGNMMENDGSYTINDEYIERVREIVDYSLKADLYTVVNIHHFDEFIIRRNSLEDCKVIFTTLWTQIAEYFKDYSGKLVFEGFNEYLGGDVFDENRKLTSPSKSKAFELTNALNQTFVDAVRATGGNNAQRVLIASGYWTNIDLTTSNSFIMPTDTAKDKLMVSVHYVDNAMYWSNKLGGSEWLSYTKSQCDLLKKAFIDKGIPVYLGETSSKYPDDRYAKNAEHTDSTECLSIVLETLFDYNMVPVLWDVNDNFYSRTEYQIINEADRALIKEISEN